MQTIHQPPGKKKKADTEGTGKVTNQDVENTVNTGTSEDSTTTESEQIVNEQSQDQTINGSDGSPEISRDEFLD
ncbi:MAG TPA: hypothetical protein VGE24_08505 [Emticicia sp.]